jgi:hypothetical protein
MKKILMIAGLVITLCNITLGVAYACTCKDQVGSCSASGEGAHCYHDAAGRCVCKTGKPSAFEEVELAN